MPKNQLFRGYRALGFVSNHVPFAMKHSKRRQENIIVTVVGRSLHIYGSGKLKLINQSGCHPGEIECVAIDQNNIYTACGNVMYAWRPNTELLRTYEGHKNDIHSLLPIGQHIVTVDSESLLKVWEIETGNEYMELAFDNDTFQITTLIHPITYVNKVLLGSEQGALQLWNLLSSKLIYTFNGWGSAVVVIEQSPVVDVVAIGLANGQIIVHNLQFDETIVKFLQEWGPVTSLSFRQDGFPILASGSPIGNIAFWNLEERKLSSQLVEAHHGTVGGMKFLPSEPLMVTTSSDNTLKMWIFDMSDGAGRLHKIREGHHAPPTKIRFHGAQGDTILSAGQDSTLRSFSVQYDLLNKNLGQASSNRKLAKKLGMKNDRNKLNPMTDFTSETTRDKEWDSIACCHRDLSYVTTWSFDKCKMGEHKLQHKRFKTDANCRRAIAQCVELSNCGNFVFIGYNTGHVDKFNIQSGKYRGSYGDPKAHNGPVNGVVADGLNQRVISGGNDAVLKLWRFDTKQELTSLKTEAVIAKLCLHRGNNSLAVVLDSFEVLIVDVDSPKVVRRFAGHAARITDVAFSSDCRWLITASMDRTIRTWDLPSACQIDCFLVPDACTSLAMSPTSAFIATTHVDNLGVYLWANTTLYSHVPLNPLPEDYQPTLRHLPTSKPDEVSGSSTEGTDMEADIFDGNYVSPDQISSDLVTFSGLSSSHWEHLLQLDIIKKRNKPKEPPKAPKAAPFFLPTVAGLQFKFDLPKEDGNESRVIRTAIRQGATELMKALDECKESSNYWPAMDKLKLLGPSGVDLQIRSLSPDDHGSETYMLLFLKMLRQVFESKKDYELANSYLALFYQIHTRTCIESSTLSDEIQKISIVQESSWKQLQDRFMESLCLVNFVMGAVMK